MFKPIVGIHLSDYEKQVQLFFMVRESDAIPLMYHEDTRRWQLLQRGIAESSVACVIDDDPETITAITALGVDGVIYDTPDNRHFSWHLRMTEDTAREGLAYRLKVWKEKYHAAHPAQEDRR